MKIFLLGASGMIGSRILAEAVSRGHEVRAAARHPDRIATLPKVQPLGLDVGDKVALAREVEAADVTISALSPRYSGDAVSEAKGFAAALVNAKPRRLVMVGGAGSLSLPDGRSVLDILPPEYTAEATGMRAAYRALAQSDLDWTVIAPAAQIAPGEKTGSYQIGGSTLLFDSQGHSHISAEDYAHALLDEVEAPQFKGELVTLGYVA